MSSSSSLETMAGHSKDGFLGENTWDKFLLARIEEHLQQLRTEALSITSEFELGPIHERLQEASLKQLSVTGKSPTSNKTEDLQLKLLLTTIYHQVFLEILTTKKLFQNKCKREFKSCFETYNLESRSLINEQFICNEKRDPTPDLYRLSQKILAQFDKALGQECTSSKIETTVRDEYRRRLAKKMGDKLVSFNEKPVKTVNIHKSVWTCKRAAAVATLAFVCIVLVSGGFVFLHSTMISTSTLVFPNVTKTSQGHILPNAEKIEFTLTGNYTEDLEVIQTYVNKIMNEVNNLKEETKANIETIFNNRISSSEYKTETMQTQLVSEVLPKLHYLNFRAKKFDIELKPFHEETLEIFNITAFKFFEVNLTTGLSKAYNKTKEAQEKWNSEVGTASTRVQRFYTEETITVKTEKDLLPTGMSLELHNNATLRAISTCIRANLLPRSPTFLFDLKRSLDKSFQTRFAENIYIGIDFGTRYIRAAVYLDGKVQRIPDYGKYGEIHNDLIGYVGVDHYEQFIGHLAEVEVTKFSYKFRSIFYDMKAILHEFPGNDHNLNTEYILTFIPSAEGKKVSVKGGAGISYFIDNIIYKLLLKIKANAEKYLGAPVKNCVITVLPDLNEEKQKIIVNAGTLAGFEDVKLLKENEAAGIALRISVNIDSSVNETVFIIQLGARYWGVSILKGFEDDKFDVISPWSWTKGGFELLNNLVNYCIDEFCTQERFRENDRIKMRNAEYSSIFKRRLFDLCEKAVIELSTKNETEVSIPSFYDARNLRVKITRDTFYERSRQPLLMLENKIIAVLNSPQTQYNINPNKYIVLSGGYSRLPRVKEIVQKLFTGRSTTAVLKNPEELVVYGAAIKGAKLAAKAYRT